jgi:hypothetical protein
MQFPMFEYFFIKKEKNNFSATKSSTSSMMHPRAARHWTLRLVPRRASKAARVSRKQGMLQVANDGIGE